MFYIKISFIFSVIGSAVLALSIGLSFFEITQIIQNNLFDDFSSFVQPKTAFIKKNLRDENKKEIEEIEKIDLSTPFKLCVQIQSDNIAQVKDGSDKKFELYIAYQTGKLEKIDITKKLTLWSSELGGEIASELIVENSKIFIVTKISKSFSGILNAEGKNEENDKKDAGNNSADEMLSYILWSLNTKTGVTEWLFPFKAGREIILSEYQNKIFLIEKNGMITALSKTDAQVVWKKNLSQNLTSSPVFVQNTIYFGAEKNSIILLSIEDGTVISKIETGNPPKTVLVTTRNEMYWGDRKGFLNFLNLTNNERFRTKQFGGEISNLTAVPGGVLVTSYDNFVYFISTQKNKTIWKRRLTGRISKKPLLMGDFVVLVTNSDSNLNVLNLKNGKVVNRIVLSDKSTIVSNPLLTSGSLIFATNTGIFAFAAINSECPA